MRYNKKNYLFTLIFVMALVACGGRTHTRKSSNQNSSNELNPLNASAGSELSTYLVGTSASTSQTTPNNTSVNSSTANSSAPVTGGLKLLTQSNEYSFGSVVLGDAVDHVFTFSNDGLTNVSQIQILPLTGDFSFHNNVPNPGFPYCSTLVSLSPGRSCIVAVLFSPSLPPGYAEILNKTAILKVSYFNGKESKIIESGLTGRAIPPVPEPLLFANGKLVETTAPSRSEVTLHWTAPYAKECFLEGERGLIVPPVGIYKTTASKDPKFFQLTCKGAGGVGLAKVTVKGEAVMLTAVGATASHTYQNMLPFYAVDDIEGPGHYWNSGYIPNFVDSPQPAGVEKGEWIEVDLGEARDISRIRLQIQQSPAGSAVHKVFAGLYPDPKFQIASFDAYFESEKWIEAGIESVRARYIRVLTTKSPSWVAWNKIRVYGF